MATNPRDVGELTQTIAAEVRSQRSARRWKQEELSDRTGINRATLSRIERGIVAIDLEQLATLAQAFSMTPEEFVAAARSSAASRRQPDEVYLADGTLDIANTRGFPPSEEDIDEILLSRRRNESNPG